MSTKWLLACHVAADPTFSAADTAKWYEALQTANAGSAAGWGAARARPLCAYPKVARYNGSGELDSAASFSCK